MSDRSHVAVSSRAGRWISGAFAVASLLYLLSGITVIGPEEIGLVLRWGRLVGGRGPDAIHSPGLLLALPAPFDEVIRLPVKREESLTSNHFWQPPAAAPSNSAEDGDGKSPLADTPSEASPAEENRLALTGDQGFVGIEFTVKYTITDPVWFHLETAEPRRLLEQIVVAETQSIINQSSIDEVLRLEVQDTPPAGAGSSPAGAGEPTGGMTSLPLRIQEQVNERLTELRTGLSLTSVEIRGVRPPAEVQDAFESLQTARIEQETTRDRADGIAAERVLEAEALGQQTIAEANGQALIRQAEVREQTALFEAALGQIAQVGRDAARERLRKEALQQVLEQSRRVYLVPEVSPGSTLRISIPSPGVAP